MNKIDEELFKEKARHYLLCYNTSCERREHCLHWLAGPYVPETDKVCTVVNVMNKDVREGNCPFYKWCFVVRHFLIVPQILVCFTPFVR